MANEILSNAQIIARNIQGMRPDDRQQNVRDEPGKRYQQFQYTVPPSGEIVYPSGTVGTAFPVRMVTIQCETLPGGGVVGPLELWLHIRASPLNDPAVCIIRDNNVQQLFFGSQYVLPAARNNGLVPVRVSITCSEDL